MVEFNPLFFERMINSCVLLLSLFLFMMILNVSEMDKRQFCYNYIESSNCNCVATDVTQLLNDTVRISGIRDHITEENIVLKDFLKK